MRVRWTLRAAEQLREALEYIANDDPPTARRVGQRLLQATALLSRMPLIGRPGQVPGSREFIVKRTPYLVVYSVTGSTIVILGVLHTRTNWMTRLWDGRIKETAGRYFPTRQEPSPSNHIS